MRLHTGKGVGAINGAAGGERLVEKDAGGVDIGPAVEGLRARTNAAQTPEQVSREAISLMHRRTAQTGGLIVVAHDGSIGLARTTRTMTWATLRSAPSEGALDDGSPDGNSAASGS